MQSTTKSSVPAFLATIVTLGFFGIMGFMVYMPAFTASAPLLVLLGSLGTSWTMIVGFYFGSSQGSQNKDLLLLKQPVPIE
jgi:hypothetical protein